MKTRLNTWCAAVLLVFAAGLGACEDNAEALREKEPVRREVCVTASAAAMTWAEAPVSRSLEPMGPEMENPIKQLAVVQFDEEGNLLRLKQDEADTYPYFYWRDFTNGGENPGELAITEEDGFKVPLFAGRQTRVCLIGNLSEEGVDSLVTRADGMPVRWADFLEKTVRIPYVLEAGTSGEVGHVREIYLFGYYEGELADGEELGNEDEFTRMDFTLARLIARLELSISLGEGVSLPDGYNVFFGLDGVEEDVYLFPNVNRTSYVHDHVEITPINRTEEIKTGTNNTFYFYVAPHLVRDMANATYLRIWCIKETNPGSVAKEEGYKVLICNDPLQETPTADGSLWINRNSIYHMSLTLTYVDSETGRSRGVGHGSREIAIVPME